MVGLNPSPEDARYVERLLPTGSRMVGAALPGERRAGARADRPRGLVSLGILLAAVLSAFLVVTERVRLGTA